MERFFTPIKQSFSAPRRQSIKTAGLILIATGLLVLGGIIWFAQSKFLPGTTLETIAIGGLTPDEAAVIVSQVGLEPPEHVLELSADEVTIASSSSELGAHYEHQDDLTQLLVDQQADWLSWLGQVLFPSQAPLAQTLPVEYDPTQLLALIEALRQQFDMEPQPPSVQLGTSGVPTSLVVNEGKDAFAVQLDATVEKLMQTVASTAQNQPASDAKKVIRVEAVVTQTSRQLTQEEVIQARERGEKLVGQRLVFTKDTLRKTMNDMALVSFLQLPAGYHGGLLEDTLTEWETELNRPPQNAEFSYDPETLRVLSFAPHRNGLTLDISATRESVLESLREMEQAEAGEGSENTHTKDLILAEAVPEITLASTNDLGINERIGFGESYYSGSIPNRIHNVSLTAQRINMAIVPPGKEFSFNKTLGDVSAATGFRSAYIIKDGRTSLGDGGGVCQVSTTLFRALLDAGLNITRRLQHSYRVSYYELDNQPGFDATVYAGNVDLWFINDTDHHVLIYTEANPQTRHMFVELYGTSDGRTTEITNYQSWDYRPALPPEYIPDPSLAPGQLQQVDWPASGIKTQFTHIVRDKDGQVMSERNYYSNYRPWSAKFLQGVE